MVAVESLGITSTSYLSMRFPALISGSKMEVYGKLNCSSTRRVQPSSMLPPPKRWYIAIRCRFISCAPLETRTAQRREIDARLLGHGLEHRLRTRGNHEIAGAQSGGRLVHAAQRHALVEQQIHRAEAVVEAAVRRIAVAAARDLSGRLDRRGDLLHRHLAQFVHRIHAHSHVFEHGVGGHIVRADRRAIAVARPLVIRVKRAVQQIADQAHFRLRHGDHEGAGRIHHPVAGGESAWTPAGSRCPAPAACSPS